MTNAVRRVDVSQAVLEVEVSGEGKPLLLVHGFPHTRDLWRMIVPTLARTRQVLAVDLRGVGGSSRATSGYDAVTLADDLTTVLGTLAHQEADVVAIDAGVPPVAALALTRPELVRRLVLMESTLGTLPGAEAFFSAGAPWWFGFHRVPGLAESVLVGHEGEYLDFFYRSGTHDGRGIDPAIRDAFVTSYSGTESLRCGFEFYRAMPEIDRQLRELVEAHRITAPTLAIGADTVGSALHDQLVDVADDLRGTVIADCGHIVPLDEPDVLLGLLAEFFGEHDPHE